MAFENNIHWNSFENYLRKNVLHSELHQNAEVHKYKEWLQYIYDHLGEQPFNAKLEELRPRDIQSPLYKKIMAKLDLGYKNIKIKRAAISVLRKYIEFTRKESNIKIYEKIKKEEELEAKEGKQYKREAKFRERNRELIAKKKMNSNYRCELCGMNFEETYGDIGKEYIVAHHIIPLGTRKKESITTLGDIALVCANCHVMIHREEPPIPVGELHRRITPERQL